MKIRKSAQYLLLLLCSPFLLTACPRDVAPPPDDGASDGTYTYGTVDLDIEHKIPIGIGHAIVETTVPLKFAVKKGNRTVAGEIAENWEVDGFFDLKASGDVARASTTLYVPVTYEIRGIFDECAFKFDIVEIMHFTQVRMMHVLAWGDIPVDIEDDVDWTYFDLVLTHEIHELIIKDPTVTGRLYLSISNVSLPAELQMICFPNPE